MEGGKEGGVRDVALLREGSGAAGQGGWKCRNRSPGNTKPRAILQVLKCSLNAIFSFWEQ